MAHTGAKYVGGWQRREGRDEMDEVVAQILSKSRVKLGPPLDSKGRPLRYRGTR